MKACKEVRGLLGDEVRRVLRVEVDIEIGDGVIEDLERLCESLRGMNKRGGVLSSMAELGRCDVRVCGELVEC